MSMFWKDIELNRTEGSLNWVWDKIDFLSRKRNKSEHEQKQLAELEALAISQTEHASCHRERFDRCERSDSSGWFGLF